MLLCDEIDGLISNFLPTKIQKKKKKTPNYVRCGTTKIYNRAQKLRYNDGNNIQYLSLHIY